jgi:hypothetical protein
LKGLAWPEAECDPSTATPSFAPGETWKMTGTNVKILKIFSAAKTGKNWPKIDQNIGHFLPKIDKNRRKW